MNVTMSTTAIKICANVTCYSALPLFVYFRIHLTITDVNIPKHYQKQRVYNTNLQMINRALLIVVFLWCWSTFSTSMNSSQRKPVGNRLSFLWEQNVECIWQLLWYQYEYINNKSKYSRRNTMPYFAGWTCTRWKHTRMIFEYLQY